MNPIARRTELEIQSVDDELVVFDVRSNEAHCLHPLAARVWELADGSRSVAEIAQASGEGVTVGEVWSALDGLADADLLEQRIAPPGGESISRRSAVRRVAAAAAFASSPALIRSIIAPTPLQAQSAPDGETTGKSDQESQQKEMDAKLDQESQQKEAAGKSDQEQVEKAAEQAKDEELDAKTDSEQTKNEAEQEQQAKAAEVLEKQQEQQAKAAEQLSKR